MPIFYVATTGDDLLGDGSLAAPFASLEHALGLESGDFTLVDSTTIYVLAGSYNITKTLHPESVQNLTVRAYPNAVVTLVRDFDDGPLFDFVEMPQATLADFTIKSNYDFESLIKITNCNLSNLVNLKIKDTSIAAPTVAPAGDIFHLLNTYTSINFCEVIDSEFPGKDLTLVNCQNASFITITNSTFKNVSADSVTGIACNSGNLRLETDTLEIAHLGGESIGVKIALAAVKTEILMDNFKIHHCDYGITVSNNPQSHSEFIRIRRGEFYDLKTAIQAETACFRFYNNNVTHCDYGIVARLSSKINTFNNIFFKLADYTAPGSTAAIRAIEASEVTAYFTVFYDNVSSFAEASGGLILRQEFVRFMNPKFTDPDNRVLTLAEDSPLIDIGYPVDFTVAGAAVDIGKYDIDRIVPIEELESLTAKLITRTYRPQLLGSIDAQALINDILQEVAPDTVAREGSVINDLLVKPHALLYQRFIDAFMLVARNQSILAAEFMSTDELDAFSANHYVSRIPGTLATVTVRIYSPTPLNLYVTPQDMFSTSSSIRFFPRQYVSITAAEMSQNVESNNYFMDVPCEAENFGSDYNVSAGEVTDWLGAPNEISHVINLADSSTARDAETNEELINRTVFSIGNRSLVNPIGIPTIIRQEYPEIMRVVPIGAGDPEMVRDILASFHVYGKTDIYVSATELALSYMDILNAEEITLLNRTTMGNVPMIDIKEVIVLDPDTGEETILVLTPNQYSLTPHSADDRYGIDDNLDFTVHTDFLGADIRIKFRWSPQILLTQNFCVGDEQRVLCEDIKVKHMIPVFLSFNVNYKSYGDLDHAAILARLTQWINEFPPEEEFQVSDIIDVMYEFGADFVEQPLIVEAVYLHANGVVETKFFQNTNTLPRIYGYIADVLTLTRLP